jgi:hypothetical protein
MASKVSAGKARVTKNTHLATRVQLTEHVPKLHVPKAYMLVLRPSTRSEDPSDVRVPRERFDSRRMFVEFPQRRVARG